MLCKIIPEKCIACGLCQVYAPEIFDYTNEGIVVLKNNSEANQEFVTENQRDNVLIAYRKCPVRAIEIIDK